MAMPGDGPEAGFRPEDRHDKRAGADPVCRFPDAPDADQKAFLDAGKRHYPSSDPRGIWYCTRCRAFIGVNELDIVRGTPEPSPICPTRGCDGAGWSQVAPR